MRICLALALALISLMPIHAQQTFEAKVLSVNDGNAVNVAIGDEKGRMKLFHISAPLRDADQPFWKESKAFLEKRIGGKTVEVEVRGVGADFFWIIRLNGKNINFEMVKTGHAWYQPAHGKNPEYERAQEEAKRKQRGLWGFASAPIEPWNYRQLLEDKAKAAKEKAAVIETVNRLFEHHGGREQLNQLDRLVVSVDVYEDGKPVDVKIELAWDIPRDRFLWAITAEGKRAGFGQLGKQLWSALGDQVKREEVGEPVKAEHKRDLWSWVNVRLAYDIADTVGRFQRALREPRTEHDMLEQVEATPQKAREYLAVGKSDIESASQSLTLFGYEYQKSRMIAKLHLAKSGALIALESSVAVGMQDPYCVFFERHSLEGYVPQSKASRSFSGLCGVRPLTKQDATLFNPPEVNAAGVDGDEAE